MNKTTFRITTQNIIYTAAFIALLMLLTLTLPSVLGKGEVKAQQQPSSPHPAPESGQAFSISPPLIELQGNPGDVVKTKVKFTNLSKDELLVKTQFNDFGAKNETGEPNILFDDKDSSAFSLRSWIGNPTPFKIASKETKTVEFPISIPKNAEPGGHYAVIRFTGTSPDAAENSVALTASIGSLVLMRVSGDVQEKATVADFFTATPRYEKTTFFEQSPVNLVERIRNDGNIHIKPTGTVKVKDMFGKEVANVRVNGSPNDPKDPPRSILPSSIRRFEQKIDQGWMFGRYEATTYLNYGEGQSKNLSATTSFWVIPYKLIVLILVGLIALFFLVWFGLKRYNRYIISKAQASEKDEEPVKNKAKNSKHKQP